MNIKLIGKCIAPSLKYASVTFSSHGYSYALTTDLYKNALNFECYTCKVDEYDCYEYDFETVKELDVYYQGINYSNLTFDDFAMTHMIKNMNVSIQDLDVIWLMYCYLIDDNKTEHEFRLELAELLK